MQTRLILLLAALIAFASAKAAEDAPNESSEELRTLDKTVIESDPAYDWIKINSGEWLKGRVKYMLDEKLEFDSKELDLQTFDWSDVYFLYSPKLNSISTEDKATDSGTLWIDRTNVVVTSSRTNTYPRSEILGIAPGGAKERNYWSGSVSLGLAFRAGNVNQVDMNSSANLKRITPNTRLTFDYLGNYSALEDVESANNHRVSVSFDMFLSRRLFVRAPFFEYYRDPFQNIDNRYTAGVGLGYDIIKSPKFDWSVTGGPAYQYIQFDSVAAGEDPNERTPALVLGTTIDWDITSKLEFEMEMRSQITTASGGNSTHHFLAKLTYEATRVLDLETSFIVDSVANPTADSSGNVPSRYDSRLVFGMGVDF